MIVIPASAPRRQGLSEIEAAADELAAEKSGQNACRMCNAA